MWSATLNRRAGFLHMTLAICLMAGCGSATDADWTTHTNDPISFELPENWEEVAERRGLLFAPEDEKHEQYQIEIRVSHNPQVDARKIRNQWLGMRDISEREGRLISAEPSTLNSFDRFDLVRRAPAPSEQLIPAEYQVAGDQIAHQVMLIDAHNVSVIARLRVEEADYPEYLTIFEQTLRSIRSTGI